MITLVLVLHRLILSTPQCGGDQLDTATKYGLVKGHDGDVGKKREVRRKVLTDRMLRNALDGA